MIYKTVRQKISFGEFHITVEVLVNFQAAMDQLREHLQSKGMENRMSDYAPYFGLIWDAARGLSVYLSQREDLPGKRMVEIGCGLAIPSMLAAKKGASVVATDLHPGVGEFLQLNLKLNGLDQSQNFKYLEIDWRENLDTLFESNPEIIFGSDIMYDKKRAESVAQFVAESFKRNIKEAVIADSGRPYIDTFVKGVEKYGLTVRREKLEVIGTEKKPIAIHLLIVS